MNKLRSRLYLTVLLLCLVLTFCSCQKMEEASLYVKLAAARVKEENLDAFATHLNAALPQYTNMDIRAISLDDSGASFQTIVFMYASEAELFVCEGESADSLSGQGENFMELHKLFSKDELASFKGKVIQFPRYDDNGVLTGEKSPVCGLDLSDSEKVVTMTGMSHPQIFIVASTKNIDAAKEAFIYLARL